LFALHVIGGELEDVMASVAPIRPVSFPYGVADEAGRRAYVADGAGGIRALDLADGHPIWRTDAAERPLLVVGDRLLALKRPRLSVLEVVVLDTTAPDTPLITTPPITLPSWVVAGIVDNDRFALSARIDETGRLEIAWNAHAVYAGGAVPPAQVVRDSERVARGTIRVELTTGRVEAGIETGTESPAGDSGPSEAPVLAHPTAASTLAANIVADRIYSIVDAGGARLALRAADRATARTVWEVPLTSATTKPPPRRQ
jgi:outer membrane protein assembly factor BamB